MRVSDAERAEVADRLSQHYGDGRLDQAEFSRRLDQAMGATTQADLNGLFDDLPDTGPAATGAPVSDPPAARPRGTESPKPAARPRRRSAYHRVLGLVALVVIAVIVGHALAGLFVPWLLIAAVAFAWLHYGTGRRHRGSPGDREGPEDR
jgi:hypothetical protein